MGETLITRRSGGNCKFYLNGELTASCDKSNQTITISGAGMPHLPKAFFLTFPGEYRASSAIEDEFAIVYSEDEGLEIRRILSNSLSELTTGTIELVDGNLIITTNFGDKYFYSIGWIAGMFYY